MASLRLRHRLRHSVLARQSRTRRHHAAVGWCPTQCLKRVINCLADDMAGAAATTLGRRWPISNFPTRNILLRRLVNKLCIQKTTLTLNEVSPKKMPILPQKQPRQIFCSGSLSGCLNLGSWAGRPGVGGWQMQWRSRVSVALSAVARSFTPTERARVLVTLVRGRRLRQPQAEETSAPWSNRGLPSYRDSGRTLQCYGSLSTDL